MQPIHLHIFSHLTNVRQKNEYRKFFDIFLYYGYRKVMVILYS